jgi:hypothetical protein
MLKFNIEQWGGLNLSDEPEKILLRSHQFVQNVGWSQKAPVECGKCDNLDFSGSGGIYKRNGSTLVEDFSSLFSNGEYIIDSINYTSSNGSKSTIIVTTLSIYITSSNTTVKINNSSSTEYNHAESVSKCSFAIVDGHLFIGLNAGNKIQVYRSGADLDDELDQGNTYTDSFGSGTNTIDGVWSNGYYLLTSFQGRLIYSDGNTVVNYSTIPIATDGVWKRSTHGFYQTSGRIISLNTYTPDYQDSIQETLYIFTEYGPQITNDLSTQIQTIEGGPVPINNRSVVATKSWLMMLTNDRRIVAVNRNIYIDIGRRFNSFDGTSEIEVYNIQSSEDYSFGYYNKTKEQVYFFIPGKSVGKNNKCFVIDMLLGEPAINEPLDSYERRVRLSIWSISNNDDFYSSLTDDMGVVKGYSYNGKSYLFLSGKNDYDSIPVESNYQTLDFRAGVSDTKKMFKLMNIRGRFLSKFDVSVKYLIDQSENDASVSYAEGENVSLYGSFKYGENKYQRELIIKGKDRIHLKGETFSISFFNKKLNETFFIRSLNIDYQLINREI